MSNLRPDGPGSDLGAEPARSGQPFTLELFGYLMGPFLSMVDSSIVNVAVVDIARSLGANLAATQWVVSAYLLAMSAALPLTGWLSRRFGNRRVFATSIVGFTVASALCGLSPNLGMLVAARSAQGLFGAFLVPLAMTKLLGGSDSAQQSRTSPAAILVGLFLFMAPAIAPSVGGLLLQAAGWPLIFFVNLPFGIFGVLVVSTRGDREAEPRSKARFDFVGLAILSAGLAGVTYGSSQGPASGWLSSASLPFWVGGILAVALYGVWATKSSEPAISLASVRRPEIAASYLITCLSSIAAFGLVVLVVAFLQDVQGFTPLEAGLAMIPQALLTGIGTGFSPAIVARIGLRPTVAAGLLLLAAGTLLLAVTGPATPLIVVSMLLIGRAFATGLVVQPLTMMINSRLPETQRTEANTLFMIFDELGGALGVAVIMTLFEQQARSLAPKLHGSAPYAAFHESVAVLSLVALVALVAGMALLRRRDATAESTSPEPAG